MYYIARTTNSRDLRRVKFQRKLRRFFSSPQSQRPSRERRCQPLRCVCVCVCLFYLYVYVVYVYVDVTPCLLLLPLLLLSLAIAFLLTLPICRSARYAHRAHNESRAVRSLVF